LAEVIIRRLAPSDADLFDRVDPDVFDVPVRPDRIAAYLAEPNHMMILALADGLVVGQCAAVVHRHPDKVAELYIDEVGTASGWRRQGIGRRMMAEMIAWGRERGCGEAWVGTETDNEAALELYRHAKPKPLTEGVFVMFEFDLHEGTN
jgi:aminoglycoside 6'-N-acetyltransferase I